jgi:hypothetical protein
MDIYQSQNISSWAQAFNGSLHVLGDLIAESSEVVVFGSRAVGVQGFSSDLDVLAITPAKRAVRARGLDCVVLTPQDVGQSLWLGSELASHIVQFGQWVKGEGEWRNRVWLSERAVLRKRRRVNAVMRNASLRWPRLHRSFRLRYATTMRRELQRLSLLLNRLPIPPTAILDAEWQAGKVSALTLLALIDASETAASLSSVPGLKNLTLERGSCKT